MRVGWTVVPRGLVLPDDTAQASGLTVHDKSRSLSVVPNTLGSSIGEITAVAAAAPLPKSRATHSERIDPRGGGGGREKWVATVE